MLVLANQFDPLSVDNNHIIIFPLENLKFMLYFGRKQTWMVFVSRFVPKVFDADCSMPVVYSLQTILQLARKNIDICDAPFIIQYLSIIPYSHSEAGVECRERNQPII